MSLAAAQVRTLSNKREAWIVVGKHRVRIPCDLHSGLTRFSESRHYSKTFDALIYCASVGLKVLEASEHVHVINVNKGDRD